MLKSLLSVNSTFRLKVTFGANHASVSSEACNLDHVYKNGEIMLMKSHRSRVTSGREFSRFDHTASARDQTVFELWHFIPGSFSSGTVGFRRLLRRGHFS
jgi:hypothetical protein